MKNVLYYMFLGMFSALVFTGCLSDDPVNEQELITKFTYTLTPVNGGETVVLQFSDPDGDGGNAPQITTSGSLVAGGLYNGQISIQNEASMPPIDITAEIKEESEDHQFFFLPQGNLTGKINIAYNDIDNNGDPVGILTEVVAVQNTTGGKLRIVLRHEPDKSATGVKNGNISNAGGESDIDIEFDLNIK